MAQRSLLEAEGTAKFSTPTKSPKDRRFLARVLRTSQGSRGGSTAENDSPNGTIPYLGTFLTDLTFIDSAIPDHVQNGLINFEKRKKEFEILAQVCIYEEYILYKKKNHESIRKTYN
jgi:ral guanine nucleotide dissociation stimulator-like 1